MEDERYFKKARIIASVSDYDRTHVGCVAIYKKHIIGIGCNGEKTHPMQTYYNKFRSPDDPNEKKELLGKVHAEMMCLNAISKLDIDFSKVHLYVYRIRKDRPFGLSKPCPACIKAIKEMGIKHIHYTTNDGYAYEKILVNV